MTLTPAANTTVHHDRAAKEQANAEREKMRKEARADELRRKVDRLTELEEKAERKFERSQKNNGQDSIPHSVVPDELMISL